MPPTRKRPPARRKARPPAERPAYREVVIDSWARFQKTVLSPRYHNWAFRGQSNADWPLESTLTRRFKGAKLEDPRAWFVQEYRILRIFKRKAHLFLDHVPDEHDTFRWLALIQHHGAPTRLLDFTWSPYVAAFFALENTSTDAAIWAVNTLALNTRTLRLTIRGREHEIWGERVGPWNENAFEEYFIKNEHEFVIYGEPRSMNQRLIAQSGTFLIPSTHAESVAGLLGRYPEEMLVKFRLKTAALREAAMLALYSMNVTYYSLFPGLDGLARSMGYEAEYNWWYDLKTMERRGAPAAAGRRGV